MLQGLQTLRFGINRKFRFSTTKKNDDVLPYRMFLTGILFDFIDTEVERIPQK